MVRSRKAVGMVRHPHGETVTIHPYLAEAGVDDYNNPIEGFGDDIERTHCAIEPRVESEEIDGNRAMVVRGFKIYDTFDSPVGPHDELTVRGSRCRVDGEIERWADPFRGKLKGSVISVVRVDG